MPSYSWDSCFTAIETPAAPAPFILATFPGRIITIVNNGTATLTLTPATSIDGNPTAALVAGASTSIVCLDDTGVWKTL